MNRTNPFNNADLEPKELYKKLKMYYDNNSLYDDLQYNAYIDNTWIEAIKPLRTVVNRSVEFYVSKVLPGDLSQIQVSADSPEVEAAIEQVWNWSNFSAQKQVAVRYLSLYGNLFMRVSNDEDKVFFEIIDPKYVTSFKTDSRGYITEIRIDIPFKDENGIEKIHTEFWNKEYFAIWEHSFNENTPLDQLGDSTFFGWLSELGIDFVPVVQIKFRDTGEQLGKACVQHALDKIDESNREATRLAELLFRFNKPTMIVSANDKDNQGRPLPAPKVKTSSNTTSENLTLKDESILYVPGMAQVQTLVPQLDYDAVRNIIKDMMEELQNDLPELRYYSLQDNANASGKALRTILAGAVDRAEEARSNFIQGLVRLNQMALTIGSFWNLFGQIGTFENGDFEHSINSPEMFGSSLEEKAITLKELVVAGMPLASAMKFVGFSDEEIAEVITNKQAEDTRKLEQEQVALLNNAIRLQA